MATVFDLAAAKVNPRKYFKNPKDVLLREGLTRTAKIEILRQWEIDARLLAVAEEENMQDGESSQLGAVINALLLLNDEAKHPHYDKPSAPTKLGN